MPALKELVEMLTGKAEEVARLLVAKLEEHKIQL